MKQALMIFAIFLTANVVFAQISATALSILETSSIEAFPRTAKVCMVDAHTSISYMVTVENNYSFHTFYLRQEGTTLKHTAKINLEAINQITDIEIYQDDLYFCGSMNSGDSMLGFVAKANIHDFFAIGVYSLTTIRNTDKINKIEVYVDNNNRESIAALSSDKLYKITNMSYDFINFINQEYITSYSDLIIYKDYIIVSEGYSDTSNVNNHGYYVEIFDKTILNTPLSFANKIQIPSSISFQAEHQVMLAKLESEDKLYIVSMPYMANSGYYSLKGIDVNQIDFALSPTNVTNYTIIPNSVNVNLLWDVKALNIDEKNNGLCILSNWGTIESYIFYLNLANIGESVKVYKHPDNSLFTALDVYADKYYHTIGGILVENPIHPIYQVWHTYSLWDRSLLNFYDKCSKTYKESIVRRPLSFIGITNNLDGGHHSLTQIECRAECRTIETKIQCNQKNNKL